MQAAQPNAVHDELVLGDVVDLNPKRAYGVDSRLDVGRPPEPANVCLTVGERADEHSSMRDRLVAGHSDVPDQRPGRFDSSHVRVTVSYPCLARYASFEDS